MAKAAPKAGALGHAQRRRRRQRIVQNCLHDRAGSAQPRPCKQRRADSWQAVVAHNDVDLVILCPAKHTLDEFCYRRIIGACPQGEQGYTNQQYKQH